MTRRRLALALALPVAAFASLAAQTTKSVWTGVYTAEQATRGTDLYQRTCSECHGDDLEGRERSPALAGEVFAQRWDGATLKKLFEHMEQMPPGDPAKHLKPNEYADVLAFLLSANEVPAGSKPLVPDTRALASIAYTRAATGARSSRPLPPRAGVPPPARPSTQPTTRATTRSVDWKTYGADLASTRYSPLDQINKDNFSKLKIAWRLSTNAFGPRPDSLYSATPLFVDNVLYTTVGTTRTVVALNPATGAVLWKHGEDEGPRGQNAARSGAGRGVAYWSSANGADQRILYVTPGYRMIALDAKTGEPISTFGHGGVVDLKLDDDQDLDLDTADIGLNATPLVAGDVVVVGAAHRFSGSPKTMNNTRGYVRGFDVKTGKRLWVGSSRVDLQACKLEYSIVSPK